MIMRKKLKIMVCVLFVWIFNTGYMQAQESDFEDSLAVNISGKEADDVVLTLLSKCDVLIELWAFLGAHMEVDMENLSGNLCGSDSDLRYLRMKLHEKRLSLIDAERELAEKYEELGVLDKAIEKIYIIKEPNDIYEELATIFRGCYPASLESAKLCRVRNDAVETICKEVFGSDINIYYNDYHSALRKLLPDWFDLGDWLNHILKGVKARDGFNDKEIVEFAREPLLMIYNEELKIYERFCAENKEIFEEIIVLAKNDFRIKANGAKKCRIIRDREFCATASGEYEVIKSLQDIITYINSINESSNSGATHKEL